MNIQNPLRDLPSALINECGGEFGFVCIYRRRGDPLDSGDDPARHCTVGEFLAKPENQVGVWCIDGGWGGPPGAIQVRWDPEQHAWENGGYCGRGFSVG